ncbi:MAG TPA: SPOR domain-containing protein [Bryobacteraceae bacterium]|jgi:cell division septation protein DedD|nr:SPOR domain-containing protein [Bryobacteraceae bacterium]
MRNKETGEFELVVGDKQLLSGFFIGVLLLAVVFAMGYVLGRGTPKSAPVSETAAIPSNAAAQPATSSPNVVPPSPVTPESTAPVMNPDVGHAGDPQSAAAPAEQPPQPTTVPAKEASAPEPPAPKAAPPAAAAEPANGSYWQVLAGSHSSAEAMSQTLKGRGFPVVTRPGRDNLTLVWVGPYTDKETLTKAKKQLEDAGMTNLFRKP